MEILAKIFGGQAKVKIMRIFLFNPTEGYTTEDVSTRAQVPLSRARNELRNFLKAGLIRRKAFMKEIHAERGKKVRLVRRKVQGFILNPNFEHLEPLRGFLLSTNSIKIEDVAKKMSRVGRIKLLILAGVFIEDLESRVDILVVGDRLKKRKIERVVRSIEAVVGKELKYAAFETADFQYRLTMFDKLIRDILDFPHKTVVDKLGVSGTQLR